MKHLVLQFLHYYLRVIRICIRILPLVLYRRAGIAEIRGEIQEYSKVDRVFNKTPSQFLKEASMKVRRTLIYCHNEFVQR